MSVDPKLAAAIAQVESRGRLWPVRYEPAWSYTTPEALAACIKAHDGCTENTAKVLCASSWGLYQIMGANLYEKGLVVPVGVYLNDRQAQDDALERFLGGWSGVTLAELLADDPKLFRFARFYNGPGDPAGYAKLIRAAA